MGGGDLAKLQGLVARAVRAAEGEPAGAAIPDVREAASLVRPSHRGLAPGDRLEIYREQYWLRHLANLDEDYPTLTWVLGGQDAFHALAKEYLEAFPPRTWDLQRLGADLPAFVAAHARLGRDSLACDAARLDWAFMEAFDAPDSAPFDPRVLASTPEDAWPGARIDLHASLRTLSLAHPVHELRLAVLRGTGAERPTATPTCVAVHRDAANVLRSLSIEPLALALLDALRAGTPLGEACELVARASGKDSLDVGAELGGWFQQWTACGWIRAVRPTTA